MKRFLTSLAILLMIFTLKSCYNDVEEEVEPTIPVDSCQILNVSYKLTVSPIISANCFNCHSEANKTAGAGIVLEGYANFKVKIDDGTVLCAINYLPCAASPMPTGAPALESCLISQIEAWVADGAANN